MEKDQNNVVVSPFHRAFAQWLKAFSHEESSKRPYKNMLTTREVQEQISGILQIPESELFSILAEENFKTELNEHNLIQWVIWSAYPIV